jgi:phosphonate degradation associated HDIG domain protein
MTKQTILDEIRALFREHGESLYGGEQVTQLEHALQAADLAEQEGASSALIAAALLHDIGHLLHDLPEDAPDHGVDDVHEELGYAWLRQYFDADLVEPVRMHVVAKRYLCAIDSKYHDALSDASRQSLALQGGPFTDEEARRIEDEPRLDECLRLRRWDDLAKFVGAETPDLDHFLIYVEKAIRHPSAVEAAS